MSLLLRLSVQGSGEGGRATRLTRRRFNSGLERASASPPLLTTQIRPPPPSVTGPPDPKWCLGLITVAMKKSEGERRTRPALEGLSRLGNLAAKVGEKLGSALLEWAGRQS